MNFLKSRILPPPPPPPNLQNIFSQAYLEDVAS